MKYEIVSYCSEDYKDGYEFVIQSWLKNTNASKIVIYTDNNNIKPFNEKVEIRNEFPPVKNNWIVGTARRIDAVSKYLASNPSCDYFVFLDIDCYIVEQFEELFDIMDKFFDVTLTRLAGRNDHANGTATAGVFFAKNNKNSRTFTEDWKKESDRFRSEGKGIIPHKVSFVQYGFTKVITDAFDGRKPYKVYVASEKVYNFENPTDLNWGSDVKKYRSKIIHLKGRRWRNKVLVADIMKELKERN